MSKQTSIASWLDGDEPPDFYRLLGRRRLDPDIDGLTAAVKAAFGELLPYQNHADPAKARRAMSLLTELGRVESLLADAARLAEANQRLTAELARQCAERFAAAGPHWKRPDVRAWLERDEQISPAALEETLSAVCAALPQPPAVLKPLPVSPRVFAISDNSPVAEQQVVLPPTTELEYVILDDEQPLVGTKPGTTSCPHCGTRVSAQAAICVDCGYDFRTGQRLTTKTSRPEEAARPAVPRPPAPPRNLRPPAPPRNLSPSPAARASNESSVPWVLIVAGAGAVVFLILVAGGLGLLAIRVRHGEGSAERGSATALSDDGPGDLGTTPDSTGYPFPQDERHEGKEEAGESGADESEKQPADPASQASLAKGKFDAAYRRATLADAEEFDEVWADALRLAPDAASRRLVHETKIASLKRRPAPLPADAVEKLCAAYDLYFADAQSADEQLRIGNSLISAMMYVNALGEALARYLALNDEALAKPWREMIVQGLTKACLSKISWLPPEERLAACERLVALVKGDEATRLAAYRLLAGDAMALSRASLDKLWEIFDVVLDGPANGPALNYLPILLGQVQRRGAQSKAIEHYQEMASQGPNRELGQRVLEALRQMLLAQNRPPFPAGPPVPGAVPPGLPPKPSASPPSKRRRPTQSPAVDPNIESVAQEFLALARNDAVFSRKSISELQDLYDSAVEQTGRVRDAGDLTRALIAEFTRRQLMSQPISHYEKQLRNDPDCLPALYFLLEANRWRESKRVNANSYREKSQDILAHLRILAPQAAIK